MSATAATSRDPDRSESDRDGPARSDLPRVLVVGDHLGSGRGVVHGGTVYFRSVLPALASAGVPVALCVLGPHHPALADMEARGIPTEVLDRAKWSPYALGGLVACMRRHDADLVQLVGMKSLLLGRIAARIAGRKALLHFHDMFEPMPWLRAVQRRLAPWAAGAIAVSSKVRDWAAAAYGLAPERIEVLHNGLDLARFRPPSAPTRAEARAALGIAPDTSVIVAVGRLQPYKGHTHLLRALARLQASSPARADDMLLLVVGEGPSRGALEDEARAHGLLARERGLLGPERAAVRFLGQRDDIPAILPAADVMAVPSLSEGFGLVALEGAAAGLPVVAFATGGLPDVIADGTSGLLVPTGDEAALAAALARVLADRDLAARLAAGARERAQAFGLDRHVADLIDVYRRICTGDGFAPVNGDRSTASKGPPS